MGEPTKYQKELQKAFDQEKGLIGQDWRNEISTGLSGEEAGAVLQDLLRAAEEANGEDIQAVSKAKLDETLQNFCNRVLNTFEAQVVEWVGAQQEWADVSKSEWEDVREKFGETAEEGQELFHKVNDLVKANSALEIDNRDKTNEINEQKEQIKILNNRHADELAAIKKENNLREQESDKAHLLERKAFREQLRETNTKLQQCEKKLDDAKKDAAAANEAYDRAEARERELADEKDEAVKQLKKFAENAENIEPLLKEERDSHAETQKKLKETIELLDAEREQLALEREKRRKSSGGSQEPEQTDLGSELGGDWDSQRSSSERSLSPRSPTSAPKTPISPEGLSPKAVSFKTIGGVRGDCVLPILRQVAHHRAQKDFVAYDLLHEVVSDEDAVLEALGALLSNYGFNFAESAGEDGLEFPFGELEQWLKQREGDDEGVAGNVKTIQDAFDEVTASLKGEKEAKAKEIEEKLDELNQEKEELAGKQKSAESKLRKLEAEREELAEQDMANMGDIKDLQRENADLGFQTEELNARVKELEAENEELHEFEASNGVKIKNLEQENENLTIQQNKSEGKLKALKDSHDQLKALSAELTKREAESADELKNRIAALDQEGSKKANQIDDLTQTVDSLKEAYAAARDEFKQLSDDKEKIKNDNDIEIEEQAQQFMDQMQKLNEDLRDLDEQRKEAIEDQQRLSDELKKAKRQQGGQIKKLAAAEAEKEQQRKRIEQLEKPLNSLIREHRDLAVGFAKLREEFQALQAAHEKVLDERRTKEKQIEDLGQKLKDINGRQTSLEQELKDLQQDRAQLAGQNESKINRIAELEKDLRDLDDKQKSAMEELKALREKYDQLEASAAEEAAGLVKRNQELEQEVLKLRKDFTGIENGQDDTDAELKALKSKYERLLEKSKNSDLMKELARTEQEILNLYGTLEEAQTALEQDDEANKAKIKELEREKQSLQAEVKGFQGDIDELFFEKAKLDDDNKDALKLQDKIDNTMAKLETTHRQIEELQLEIDSINAKLGANKQELKELQQKAFLDAAHESVKNAQLIAASLGEGGGGDNTELVRIGRLLLRYYRHMEAVLEKYRGEKLRLLDADTGRNPGFMEDMDSFLEADRRRLEQRLDDTRERAPLDQVALLEREVEKYRVIVDEINVHNTLAAEALVVSERWRLDPDPRTLLREDDDEGRGDPSKAVTEPRRRDGAETETCCCLPCDPCDWLFWVLVLSIVFFVVAFIAQQRLRYRWSAANGMARSMYIVSENYSVSITAWHIVIFLLLNIKAFILPLYYNRNRGALA
ncbi:hypothetical protein KJ359_009120 [Pestalotiopsis sp. 9143b]|nr:hypothetical protein KJ359_009120 [Pestalotiopsis sp. 9143b]